MPYIIDDLPYDDPSLHDEQGLEKENEHLRSRIIELEKANKELEAIAAS